MRKIPYSLLIIIFITSGLLIQAMKPSATELLARVILDDYTEFIGKKIEGLIHEDRDPSILCDEEENFLAQLSFRYHVSEPAIDRVLTTQVKDDISTRALTSAIAKHLSTLCEQNNIDTALASLNGIDAKIATTDDEDIKKCLHTLLEQLEQYHAELISRIRRYQQLQVSA